MSLWIKLDKCIFRTDEAVHIAFVYIPSQQSKYYSEDSINKQESEIIEFQAH